MDDLLGGLCILGIVICVIVAVGHGIWVAIAALFGALSGAPVSPPRRTCPACRALVPEGRTSCVVCGWGEGTREQPPVKSLEFLEGEIERLCKLGLIDSLAFERLNDAVQKELIHARKLARRRVAEPETPGVAAAAPGRRRADSREPAIEITDFFEPEPGTAQGKGSAGKPELAAASAESARAATQQEPLAPAPARPRQRSWTELLDGFMEERNLRWGELVGGLLIVCGSIALVLSFWAQIAERPFLKFFVFNGFTAGMFGLGAYADQRLRLPTTSRGVFSIATLLVPLNFLAFGAFSLDPAADTVVTIAGELVSIALFALLTLRAGQTITPQAPSLLAIGVIGPSVAALLVRRFVEPDSGVAVLYGLGLLPLAFYIAAVAAILWRIRGTAEPSESDVHSLLRFLGATTFAAVLPVGLLVARTADISGTLRLLAPLVSLAAAPGLATGLSIWKRVTSPTGIRTTGSGIAVAGILVLLAGVVLAWPHPAVMLLVALVDFGVLSAVAITQSMPAAHLLALPCLSLAYLIVVHVTRHKMTWGLERPAEMAGVLVSAASGTALVPFAALLGGAAAWLRRTRRDDSRFFGLAAVVSAVLSLALVTWFGLGRAGDPGGATWVYSIYAVALLATAAVADRRRLSAWPESSSAQSGLDASRDASLHRYVRTAAWCGAALLLVAFVQGTVIRFAGAFELRHPWLLAFLTHASAMAVAAFAAARGLSHREFLESGGRGNGVVPRILAEASVMTSIAATACLVGLIPTEAPGIVAAHALWLSIIWCALAWMLRSWKLFTAFQAALTCSVVFAVATWIRTRPWAAGPREIWLDPWSWQLQGIALSLLGLGWTAVRIGLKRLENKYSGEVATMPGGPTARTPSRTWLADMRQLLSPPWPACDRVVGWLVLLALVTIAVYGAVPGVAQELSPRALAVDLEIARGVAVPATGRVVPALVHFEIPGIPHGHALEIGSWAFAAFALLLFLSWQVEEFKIRHAAGMLIALSAACPLLAGLWESDVAAASALRWVSALFLSLVSAGIWIRQPLADRVMKRFLASPDPSQGDAAGRLTALVLVVSAAPLAAMGLFVGTAAVWQYALDDVLRTTLYALVAVCGVALPIGLVLRGLSVRWMASLPPEAALVTAAAAGRRPAAASGLRQAGVLMWIFGIGPLLAVMLYIVSAALRGNPIVGPEPGTLFHRMGLAASYATPMVLCAATLVGYAVRERSAGFAFAAGLLFNVSATAAYLLLAARGGLKLDATLWIKLAQLNAVVSAAYGLCWMAAAKFDAFRQFRAESIAANEAGRPLLRPAGTPIPGLLVTQSLIGASLLAILLVSGFLSFVISRQATPALVELAEPLGRTAWFLAVVAVVVLGRLAGMQVTPGPVCAGLWSLAMMATCYACRWDEGSGLAYRTMLAAHSAAGWMLLLGIVAVEHSPAEVPAVRRGINRWTTFLGALLVVLAVRDAGPTDRLWADVAAIINVSVLAVALAAWSKRRGFLYATGALASLARTIWWLYSGSPPTLTADWPALIDVNVAAWLLPAIVSLLVERWLIAPAEDRLPNSWHAGLPPDAVGFHRTAAVLAMLCLALVAGAGLIADANSAPLAIDATLRWTALACAVGMAGVCLWDPRSVAPTFGIYLLGLVAAAVTLDRYDLTPRMIAWNGMLVLGCYTIVTGLLWLRRRELMTLARQCRIPFGWQDAEQAHTWLATATVFLSCIALTAAITIDLVFPERSLRLATGTCALMQVAAIGLLTGRGRSGSLNVTALFIGVIGAVAWAWAWLNPGSVDPIQYFVVMTAALATTTALYGLGFAKLLPAENDWTRAATQIVPILCLLTAGSVVLVTAYEASYFFTGRDDPMTWPAIVVMALTILGLFAVSLAAALIPGRDPLRLSERGRTLYVYAAEALLVVLFMNVRFTMPWLFHGFFLRYWPFIVMFLAFVGAGVSEIFRRQNRLVLAEPLERTGALLPVLPVLGFWVVERQSHYSLVLLTAGFVYSILSVMRRSFGFGLLAALAANGGLWYYLQHVQGYGFLNHPQLWLIPFAICVLGAAYLNHERLSPQQMTSIRYAASVTIYVSSTADIFLNGVAQAPWLPVVLAGLSVIGVLAGIMLRVRAFLFLGTAFLVLAMLTIIWYAAVDLRHTWLIWLTVVIAGVLILGVFAVFEKKRQDVLRVVEQVRRWSP